MPPFRWIVVAAALTLTTACANRRDAGFPPRTTTGGGSVPAMTGTGTGAILTDGLSHKQVAAKEEPGTLIAEDRSRCVVPATRFRDTAVGSRAICDWRTGERRP